MTPATTPAASPATHDDSAVDSLSFEDALRRLDTIVRRLESGDASLDEAIALYAEGDRLRARCEERLQAAQARIERITLGPDGAATGTQAFDAG